MSAPEDDHVCQDIAGARVHASPDLTPEARDAIGQVIDAAKAVFSEPHHSLVSVAAGSHPLYPPLEVTLLGAGASRVKLQLRRPGERRCAEWVPEAAVLDDPYRLSLGLEAMLRTLCPPGQGG